jgi:small ligand-binding sensory domain FIST
MRAAAAIGEQGTWEAALAQALSRMSLGSGEGAADVVFLFAGPAYADGFPDLVASVRRRTGARVLLGCSGQGVIGPSREIEGQPALSLLAFSLPDAVLRPVRITQDTLERCRRAEDWHEVTGVRPDELTAWILFADPFTLDADGLLAAWADAYPNTPVVGGLASGDLRSRRTHVFLGEQVFDRGAVALALGGPYEVHAIVSQGCTPIGEPWTITGAAGNVIEAIAGRRAYQVLLDTVQALPADLQQRARGNLFVGLAMDENREELHRGDFLIRNFLAADADAGTLTVGAIPRSGQTLQFQLRDRTAADEDLRALLESAREELGGREPIAGLLCSCNGRGVGLFGAPDHDAQAVAERLGPIPLAGFFCNGEVGPVGPRNFLHGYTASLALILRRDAGRAR